jgi:hypothetical protein
MDIDEDGFLQDATVAFAAGWAAAVDSAVLRRH